MKRIINATFYDEKAMNKAIKALEQTGFDIDDVTVHSGGKSLERQTYQNQSDELLGSASGFVYNTISYKTEAVYVPFYSSNALAVAADGVSEINHKKSLKPTSLENTFDTTDGTNFVVALKTGAASLDSAAAVFKRNGAHRIYTS